MNRRSCMAVTLLALALLAPVVAAAQPAGQGVEDRILALYGEAYRLSKRGVDVSDVVHRLDRALRLARQGDVEDASRVLDEAEALLSQLSGQASSTLLKARLEKYLAAAALASLPVLTYLLLPRLYLKIWYRSRRRWVVER